MDSGSSNISLATENITHAILAKHPKNRYVVGYDAKFIFLPLSYLPINLQVRTVIEIKLTSGFRINSFGQSVQWICFRIVPLAHGLCHFDFLVKGFEPQQNLWAKMVMLKTVSIRCFWWSTREAFLPALYSRWLQTTAWGPTRPANPFDLRPQRHFVSDWK